MSSGDKRPSLPSDPWVSVLQNFSYLASRLNLNKRFLRRLVDIGILQWSEYERLSMSCASASTSTSNDENIDGLVNILRCQPPVQFAPFCQILIEDGLSDVAQRLMGEHRHDMIVGELLSGKALSISFQFTYVTSCLFLVIPVSVVS
jgi:hypothetical protein